MKKQELKLIKVGQLNLIILTILYIIIFSIDNLEIQFILSLVGIINIRNVIKSAMIINKLEENKRG